MERKSEAVEPGTVIAVGDTSTPVMDAEAADRAYKWIVQNVSDVPITVRLAAEGAAVGEGVVLNPGGVWEEDRYAGAVCAVHAATGESKDLSLVIV